MCHQFHISSWFRLQLLLTGLVILLISPVAQAQVPAWQTAILSTLDSGNQDGIKAVASDADGNVYVAGSFLATIRIGNTTLTAVGSTDVFIAKWSSSTGRYLWAQGAGGSGTDYVNGVSVSGTSVYITGLFYGATAAFGGTILTNADASAASSDVFVAKLTDTGATGSFSWAQRAGGSNGDGAVAVTANGTSVYIAGSFSSTTASFGATTLTNVLNSTDIFIAKLTDEGSVGSFRWAQQAGGESQDEPTAIAVQGQNVYVAGFFRSRTATFGNSSLTNLSDGFFASDAFLVKLVDAGASSSFAWTHAAGGDEDDSITGVAVNGANVYITGWFNSPTIDFGATTLATPRYYSAAFVVKLTDTGSTGDFRWAQQTQSAGYILANSLAVTGTSVYVAGEFYDAPARFGSTTLPGAGSMDVFVAKLTDAGNSGSFAWAEQAGGPYFDRPTAVTVTGTRVCVAGLFMNSASFGSLSLKADGGHGFLATLSDGERAIPIVPGVRISRLNLPILSCAYDTTITLSANRPDGTWAGLGITDAQRGIFRSSVAGPGRHILTYSVVNEGQDTCSIVVRPVAVRVQTVPQRLSCGRDTSFVLVASPQGGSWHGQGIVNSTGGLFSTAAAGPGRHIVRYVVGSGLCQSVDSIAVLVAPVATPILSPAGPLTIKCEQLGQVLRVATNTPNTNYEWQYAAPASTSWQRLTSPSGALTYQATQPGRYRVRAIQGSCFAFSSSVEVNIERAEALMVPNIFTPNQDGVNDLFELKLQHPRTSHLRVFNRWGHLVFSTDTYGEFWKGTDATDGVYYYLWRYSTDCEPTEHLLRGFVTVVR